MGKIIDLLRGKKITSIDDAVHVLPVRLEEVSALMAETISDMAALKLAILAYPSEKRTYINTVLAYDELCGVGVVLHAVTSVVRCVSADVERRDMPYENRKKEMAALLHDPALYVAICEYYTGAMQSEVLTPEQSSYIEMIIKQGKRMGYDQPEENRWHIAALKKQMDAAASAFESNYNADVTTICVAEHALSGVDPAFIAVQPRDERGDIALLCNTAAWHSVMPYCTNETVRRAFFEAYHTRAYPANAAVLKQLLVARTRYAQALGYQDYASYSLASCMLTTSQQVVEFLQEFEKAAKPLWVQMMTEIGQNLPEGARLVDGVLQPWDVPYAIAELERKQCALDHREISHYFPIDVVMAGMFKVYSQFMGLSFEFQSKFAHAWHDSVQGVTVFNSDRTRVLGYVFFDLLPRSQKYSHACCWQIVPHIRRHDSHTGMLYETPGIATIIANIPLPQEGAPSLLYYDTVRMLFHEFGHALHAVLSCTSHFQTSGLKGVMRDFVELPSQILEEWLWNPEILRMMSAHYNTGKPLPDDLIEKLLASRMVGRGFFEMNQLRRAVYSLRVHQGDGAAVDIDAELERAHKECLNGIAWDSKNKEYASFGHLVPYGPRYFGYILSRIYAHDIFTYIEERGLLNKTIGNQFVEQVLRPGGSLHPEELLKSLLGRAASNKAYFDWLRSLIKA